MAIVTAALVFIVLSWVNVGACVDRGEVIHVAGKVLCQDCTLGWTEWLNGNMPIKGCRVSLTCLNGRKRVIYYGGNDTDANGMFDLSLSKYNNGKEINPYECYARLVYSTDPICNIATNFGSGRTGVKLVQPTVVHRNIFKHVVGPFYYTTPNCDDAASGVQPSSVRSNMNNK